MRDGANYYAYASPTAGRYLPVLTSTNLVDWRIHPRYSQSPTPAVDAAIPLEIRNWSASTVDKWNNNDGLVRPTTWGLTENQGSWIRRSYWAPGIVHRQHLVRLLRGLGSATVATTRTTSGASA